jgi:hypothetical protein
MQRKFSDFSLDLKALTGFNRSEHNLLTTMPKPVGGRSLKASYSTTHVRVPQPIKPEVERLIERFHNGGDESENNLLTTLDNAIVTAKSILNQKKSSRVSMSKLLTAIYGKSVEL